MEISVVMAVYNAEEYLSESIRSILEQSESGFEFIVIDDGSTDDSWQIMERYAQQDDRIVLLKNSRNLGLPASLNKGIEIAQGTYIARQDADDRSPKERFKKQLAYAQKHTTTDLIGCNAYIIDINGDVVCQNNSFSQIQNRRLALLKRKAILYHGSALIKKDTLFKVGLYDTRFYYSQDGELWLRLLTNNAKVHIIPENLYEYRVLPVKTSKKYNAQASYHMVKEMIYLKHCSKKDVDEKLLEIKKVITAKIASVPIPDFMAIYWKSLANMAYFNSAFTLIKPYKYLIKAYRENHASIGRMQFFKLSTLYALPKFVVNSIHKT